MSPARRGDALAVLAVLVLAAWAYAPGIRARQAYDDLWGTLLGPRVRSSVETLRGALDPSPPVSEGLARPWYPYRPLVEASFAWVRERGGTLYVQRAVNVGIHAAGAVLVLVLGRLLLPAEGPGPARWAALLFAAHPMAAQAVTYVYQRFVCMEALFGFACLAAYWRGRGSGWRSGWTWASLALAFLASGCKETAATLPLVLALAEWILREPGEPLRRAVSRWAPFLAVPAFLAVQVARARAVQGAVNTTVWTDLMPFGSGEYLGLQLPLWGHYARTALWPFPLGFYYDRFAGGVAGVRVVPWTPAVLGALGLMAAAAWVLLGSRRHAAPRLGLALWMAPLALEGSVFPTLHLAWNYRCYPALLGAGILFGWGISRTGRTGRLMGAAALALMALMTRHENRIWNSNEALLSRDIRHAFHEPLAWKCLGCSYASLGRASVAERFLVQALRSSLHSSPLRSAYISVLLALGRYDEAHGQIRRSLADFPGDPDLAWIAVQEAVRVGEEERIERYAALAERVEAPGPELAFWLATRLLEAGEPGRARAVLERHLSSYPGQPALHALLARAGGAP